MESKEGTGLIKRHARNLEITEAQLDALGRPMGGDYMRMWTRVLVEDDEDDDRQLGREFDAFYFLGPTDVRHFFTRGGAVTVTAGIEEYFARKFTMDPDFRERLFADPEKAIHEAGFELSDEEMAALKEVDPQKALEAVEGIATLAAQPWAS